MEAESSLPCSQQPATGPLSWARWMQSGSSRSISVRKILILSFHICLGLPSDHIPLGIPTKILYESLIYHMRATYPAHLALLGFIISVWNCDHCRSVWDIGRVTICQGIPNVCYDVTICSTNPAQDRTRTFGV